MSEPNQPRPDKSDGQTHSRRRILIVIDDSGDATDGFCGSNVPLDPPPPRRPQLVSMYKPSDPA